MELLKIRELKTELEEKIARDLEDFTCKTSLEVKNISFDYIKHLKKYFIKLNILID